MDNKEISKLTKLVRSYIKNNRNVDEKFIYDLAEIVIKQRKLGDYVKNIIISVLSVCFLVYRENVPDIHTSETSAIHLFC